MNPQPNGLPDRPSAIRLEPLEECRSLPLVLGIVGGVNAVVSVKKIPGRGGERHDREPRRFADQITRRDHRPRQVAITKNPRANHRRLGQAERHGEALGLRPGHGAVERVAHFAPKTRRRNLQGRSLRRTRRAAWPGAAHRPSPRAAWPHWPLPGSPAQTALGQSHPQPRRPWHPAGTVSARAWRRVGQSAR